jgi:rRNA small subunit pseudouridine methyltransferase Nep1
MITVALIESGIEIPSAVIRGHPAIKKDASRRGRGTDEILLYTARHRFAMNKLDNVEKRGRPDIVHRCLLLALDSPLNKMGYLKTIVHTIENKVIYFDPMVRLPKDYYQFEGLMVQVLRRGRAPIEGEALIELLNRSLFDIIDDHELCVLLTKKGQRIDSTLSKRILDNKTIVLLGAFARGEINEDIAKYADVRVNVSKYALTASSALCRLLASVENTLTTE